MTDAQAALAQVREAIAAGPRPGEWRVSKYRDGRQALIYDADDFEVARVCYPNRDADAALIAACSPANMAAILAHVETQAAEIERLTAALQHEADCVEAAKEEIERLTAALHAQPGPVSMDDVEWAGKVHLAEAIRERDELRRQLAEAWAEREAMANVLPGYYYMDPPDGGDVSVLEQLRRMAKDAERYRWLRPRFFAADFAYSDPPVCAIVFRWPESAKISANLDREIDAAMGASNE